jgi:hypothetical protein
MLTRVLSVEQARSQYLRTIAEAKLPNTGKEQDEANLAVKRAVKALQQAQMTRRLRKSARMGISRPSDWNLEQQ